MYETKNDKKIKFRIGGKNQELLHKQAGSVKVSQGYLERLKN